MAEAISLVLGVTSMFSTCIDCFRLVNTARLTDEDLAILLVKLDLQKTRLWIWGDEVGLVTGTAEERPPGLLIQ
jgi:hypothetical protein